MKTKTLILFYSVTAAIAGLLFGFDTAVISGAEQAVQRLWQTSDFVHGLAVSAALWGTVVGALSGALPNDAFGRRKTLILIGVLYAVSALGSAFAWDPLSFMLFRFVGGLGVGASSIAVPAYIAEIAPPRKRGQLVALYQFMIVVGILVAFASNYLLGGTGENDWRWMVGVEVVPAMLYLTAVLFVPESPRWLLAIKGDTEAARAILQRINPDDWASVMAAIAADNQRSIGWSAIFSARYAKPITLAVLIAFFNQVSGINAVIYNAPRLFEITGAATTAALLASVGIGIANLAFTVLGMALIDRLGRKTLMLFGSIGYITSLTAISVSFYLDAHAWTPVLVFAFIASHAVGQGAVIWVYISEIFPNVARSKGQTLGCGMHWVLAALLTLLMPYVLTNVPAWQIFAGFMVMMVLQLMFVVFYMVETKGRSLEELSADLLRA